MGAAFSCWFPLFTTCVIRGGYERKYMGTAHPTSTPHDLKLSVPTLWIPITLECNWLNSHQHPHPHAQPFIYYRGTFHIYTYISPNWQAQNLYYEIKPTNLPKVNKLWERQKANCKHLDYNKCLEIITLCLMLQTKLNGIWKYFIYVSFNKWFNKSVANCFHLMCYWKQRSNWSK